MKKISRKDAKAQRFGLRESCCLAERLLGRSGSEKGQFYRTSESEVVDDSMNAVFKEILTEVDQEA
jgi:hypothetical protein